MLVYLDNAATTRVCPEAAEAALAAMTGRFGNPSARYPLGREAAAALEADRRTVAGALGCAPGEVYFTSCGTEGDNWALRSAAEYGRRRGRHIITTAIEHDAVLNTVRRLEQEGFEVTRLTPDAGGSIDLAALRAALRPDTILVSMMLVNNELGTVLPVREAAQMVKESGAPALFHTDAVQALFKVPFTPKELGADLLTLSGHKIRAPKGIGALYIRSGLRLPPLLEGGGQEKGLRSGTEPTAQIAAFAAACRVGQAHAEEDRTHMAALKARLLARLAAEVPACHPVGAGTAPHILALTLPGYKSEVVVRALGDRGICVSAGSACHRGRPSHVYAALKLTKAERDGAFRVSFCPDTTPAEADALADALRQVSAELFPSMS